MISGGKSYVSSPPAFSNDGKKLLICTGSIVSVFSTFTAMQITSLEGHKELVTSVVVVPTSSAAASKVMCHCWTSSLDGTICLWDFSAPELMKTVNISFPVYSMVIPCLLGQTAESSETEPAQFSFISIEDPSKAQDKHPKALSGQIRGCNLTQSRLVPGGILAETRKPEFMTISSSGRFLGIKNKRKLHIWELPANYSKHLAVKKIKLHHTKDFTTLAFHPTERIVAAGDVSGRILIWRGFGKKTFTNTDGLTNSSKINSRSMNQRSMSNAHEDDRPGVRGDDDADSCTTWHWHSSKVMVLSFSSDGAYLYSGGKEGVLVVYQLDSGKKRFLPRIGTELLYFTDSLDPSVSCVSCADNRILLLKMPSMEVTKTIVGIKPPYSFRKVDNDFYGGFAFVHTTGLVAVPTENYCIQFYSLYGDREISEVRVCDRSHQPGDDITTVVTLVALSLDGSMMCTAEWKLPEEGIGGLLCLKFWTSDSLKKEFNLSTIVYDPHGDAGISAVAFHPTRCMAVSSSFGGDFKIWVSNHGIQNKDQMPQSSGWTCYAVGSYKKKSMTAAAFSADGSVLAVAAETIITLWDPQTNFLVATIGKTLSPIVNLFFVGNSEYLVSASRDSPQLCVWNLEKLSISWSYYKLHVEAVACTIDTLLFAVLILLPDSSNSMNNGRTIQGTDGIIALFNAGHPVPVTTWSVTKAKGGALAFLQAKSSSLQGLDSDGKQLPLLLAFINGNHEFTIFDPYGKQEQNFSAALLEGHDHVISDDKGGYGYASIYGELKRDDQKQNERSSTLTGPSERPWENIFSGSSHNLPPFTQLCSSFLESLLEKRIVSED